MNGWMDGWVGGIKSLFSGLLTAIKKLKNDKITFNFKFKQYYMTPGPASSVVEHSLRKIPSFEGTAVRSPPQDDFSIAII